MCCLATASARNLRRPTWQARRSGPKSYVCPPWTLQKIEFHTKLIVAILMRRGQSRAEVPEIKLSGCGVRSRSPNDIRNEAPEGSIGAARAPGISMHEHRDS